MRISQLVRTDNCHRRGRNIHMTWSHRSASTNTWTQNLYHNHLGQPQLNTMAWFSLISSCLKRRLLDAPRILCDFVDRVLVPIPSWGSKGMDCWDPTLLRAEDVPDDLVSGRPSSGRCITGAGADTTDKPAGPWLDETRGRSSFRWPCALSVRFCRLLGVVESDLQSDPYPFRASSRFRSASVSIKCAMLLRNSESWIMVVDVARLLPPRGFLTNLLRWYEGTVFSLRLPRLPDLACHEVVLRPDP